MELHQLRSFVAVAEEGHLTRAARRLSTSQPAVTAHIKSLEAEWGFPLFNRTPKGMALTEAGEELLDAADDVLRAVRQVERKARTLREGGTDVLRVGLNQEPSFLRIDAILRNLIRECPNIQLRFQRGTTGGFLNDLEADRLDVAFLDGGRPQGVHAEQLGQSRVCVVGPRKWQAEIEAADWPRLMAHPWIFLSEDCSYYRTMQDIFERHAGNAFSPQLRLQHDFLDSIGLLLPQGYMSLLRRDLADEAVGRGDAVIVPQVEVEVGHWLACSPDSLRDPAVRAFFHATREAWAPNVVRESA